MNKKFKWAAPFAVLALTCGIAAGCSGCGGHEHEYTKWEHDETGHWQVCVEDGEKSEKRDHKYGNDNKCECGAVLAVDVNITDGTPSDAHGSITLSKTTVKTGESVTVTVTADEGYQLKDLTLNGEGVFGLMDGNTYTFEATENTTVVAEFEKIASSSINAQISGKKYRVEGNSLEAGMEVTLSTANYDDVTTTLQEVGGNLVLKVDEIPGANWSVKIDGYTAKGITVARDSEYTEAIALEYELMENLCAAWGQADTVDLSKQNDGVIVHAGGYYQWVSSTDSYSSVAITAKAVQGGYRQGVFLRFKGETYDDDGFVGIEKENQDKVCWFGAGDGYKGNNLFNGHWDTYIQPLAKNEYDLTLVREGADLYVFVDGEYKGKKTLPEEYADKECYVGLFCTDAANGIGGKDRTFSIDDASDFIDFTITNETEDTHGTVSIDKPEAKINETVTVTIVPETGYKIKDVTVGGESVLSKIKYDAENEVYTYTFTAKASLSVVAEFEEYRAVDSAELTIEAAAGCTADGAQITIELLGESWTGTVANGKVTFGSTEDPVAIGTHDVTANVNGLTISLGQVAIDLSGKSTLAIDGNTIFANAESTAAGYDLKDLSITLDLKNGGKAYHNKLVTSVPESDTNYLYYKISLPDAMKTKLKENSDKKLNISVPVVINGGEQTYRVIMQNGTVKYQFYGGAIEAAMGNFWGPEHTLGAEYWTALVDGDGFYLVSCFNRTDKNMSVYIGTDANKMRLTQDAARFNDGINGSIGISMGNAVDVDSLDAGDQITIAVKYGKTLAEVGVTEDAKYAVTGSVNDEDMGTIVSDAGGYYEGATSKITITAKPGYDLKSIKIGSAAAITEGWTTNWNVYTYTLTVPKDGVTVVATLGEVEMWDSATLTLGGVEEGTKVTLSNDMHTVETTVGENGVVTFTGDKKIGHKDYSVAVGNVVFDVDYKTENSVKKSIATVTANDFTAKDNYNGGAKVIDMGAAKDSTEYGVTFNLKTTSTAAGWQQRWSLLLIDGGDNDVTGIGCISKNTNAELGEFIVVWAAKGASPDDKNPINDNNAKYLKLDELLHSDSGADMKVVRNGSKATMYFYSGSEWVEMLSVTLANGNTNLKFSCSYGVEWTVSNIGIEYVSDYVEPVEPSFTATTDITRNPTDAVDITTNDEYEVLAYDRIGVKDDAPAHVSSDETKLNVNAWLTTSKSTSFGNNGYTVTGGEGMVDGSCVYIGNGDATVVITSDVKRIRIYVGAWNGETAQTGKFTLKDSEGNVIAEYEYANDGEGTGPNKGGKNDIIDFVIDASNLTEAMTCTLNYTLTSGNLPCAGIQLLGEKTTVTE